MLKSRVEVALKIFVALAPMTIACGSLLGSSGDSAPVASVGKPCFASSECGEDQFCDSPGWCDGGTCQPYAPWCDALYIPVCGCSGESASIACDIQTGFGGVPVQSVAYGGQCRTKAFTTCDASSQCASDEVCALDPRVPCDGGVSCSGFCATSHSVGNDTEACDVAANCGSGTNTATCARAACDDDAGGGWTCAFCVYTSGLTCDAGTDCPSGQVCTPPATCNGSKCAHACVVP